jgi:hypothetical protein
VYVICRWRTRRGRSGLDAVIAVIVPRAREEYVGFEEVADGARHAYVDPLHRGRR